jgi:ATP-dependent RNA helicase SUPV3L1/SUV3
MKGESQVALITGEEKIVPPDARWFLCTAESDADGARPRRLRLRAIDEAQLGADPERGHVFTDRMLRARGREETMILGSDTLAPMVRELLPEAEIVSRPRFSTLRYAGASSSPACRRARRSSPSRPSRSTRSPRCCAGSRAARRW